MACFRAAQGEEAFIHQKQNRASASFASQGAEHFSSVQAQECPLPPAGKSHRLANLLLQTLPFHMTPSCLLLTSFSQVSSASTCASFYHLPWTFPDLHLRLLGELSKREAVERDLLLPCRPGISKSSGLASREDGSHRFRSFA